MNESRGAIRRTFERLGAAAIAIVGAAVKFGFIFVKFFGFFFSVAAYSFFFHSWTFALGFMLMIFIHELGHIFEARRQGLKVSWPTFIPFFGAYVRHSVPATPFNGALIALSGPFWGGIGALAFWLIVHSGHSPMLQALGYTGFLLNLINLVPVGFLDGGHAWQAHKVMRAERDPRATVVLWLHVALAGLLVLGMIVAHQPQSRL